MKNVEVRMQSEERGLKNENRLKHSSAGPDFILPSDFYILASSKSIYT
jgi:hypothetical protein